MSEISILLVGNTDRSEFRAARKRLDALGRVTAVPDAESAAAALAAAEMVPAVIVVAQAFPGQFPHQAIDRLRRLAPLARVLGLLGSWCEGEVRTGQPWPAAMRIYWHQWPARCGAEFARLSGGQCPAFGLPVTATDEERLLSSAQSPRSALPGVTAIYSTSPQMHEWLSAACRRCGCATVWLRPPQIVKIEGAAAVIFDGTDFSEQQLCQFRQVQAATRPAPMVALLDFPRIEDHDRALRAGAAAVLSKPLQLADLFWELERLFAGGATRA